jgi:hypothetical protein
MSKNTIIFLRKAIMRTLTISKNEMIQEILSTPSLVLILVDKVASKMVSKMTKLTISKEEMNTNEGVGS